MGKDYVYKNGAGTLEYTPGKKESWIFILYSLQKWNHRPNTKKKRNFQKINTEKIFMTLAYQCFLRYYGKSTNNKRKVSGKLDFIKMKSFCVSKDNIKKVKKSPWNTKKYVIRGFYHSSSVGKESACNAGGPGSIPRWGRSAGEGIGYLLQYSRSSRVAQLVKNPPAIQETCVWPLSWESPLEKGKATHSSILAKRIPWTSMGLQRVGHDNRWY